MLRWWYVASHIAIVMGLVDTDKNERDKKRIMVMIEPCRNRVRTKKALGLNNFAYKITIRCLALEIPTTFKSSSRYRLLVHICSAWKEDAFANSTSYWKLRVVDIKVASVRSADFPQQGKLAQRSGKPSLRRTTDWRGRRHYFDAAHCGPRGQDQWTPAGELHVHLCPFMPRHDRRLPGNIQPSWKVQ